MLRSLRGFSEWEVMRVSFKVRKNLLRVERSRIYLFQKRLKLLEVTA
jgi:hypothetical protein